MHSIYNGTGFTVVFWIVSLSGFVMYKEEI